MIIEAETPKQTFKQLPRSGKLKPGDEVIRATSDTSAIMGATLAMLKELDRQKFDEEMNDEIEAYLRDGTAQDFDPEYYLFDQLFHVMDKYCLPFSYYGFYEADGSVGCWPFDDEGMQAGVDRGELTIQSDTHPVPIFTGVETRYLLFEFAAGNKQLWNVQNRDLVWAW